MEETKSRRILILAFVIPATLYQCYVTLYAFRTAKTLSTLLKGIGAEAPIITNWFVQYYKYLPSIPFLSILFAIDLMRRNPPPIGYAAMLIFFILLATFTMQAWINEAWFLPMLQRIRSVD
jgi:hypothetical protein